jgi:hypothetical protein
VEDITGYTMSETDIPDFSADANGEYCKGVRFDGSIVNNWDTDRIRELVDTNIFTLHVTIDNSEYVHIGLRKFIQASIGGELYNVVLYYEGIVDERKIIKVLMEIEESSFFHRLHVFNQWHLGTPLRFYQVFGSISSYERGKKNYSMITPILKVAAGTVEYIEHVDDSDYLYVSRGYLPSIKVKKEMLSRMANQITFEDTREREEFFRWMGLVYHRLPITFRINRI